MIKWLREGERGQKRKRQQGGGDLPPLVVPVNPPAPTPGLEVVCESGGACTSEAGKAHLGNEECPGTSLSSRPKPKKETQREQRNENE